MGNVIALSGPTPTQQIINHFLDQFNADQQNQQQNYFQQQQITNQAGQLKINQDAFKLLEEKTKDAKLTADAEPYVKTLQDYHTAIQSAMQAGQDPTPIAAKMTAFTNNLHQTRPELDMYVAKGLIEPVMTPERSAGLDMWRKQADQQHALAAGGTDPIAMDAMTRFTTGANLTPQMSAQSQAVDLEARGKAGQPVPNAASAIPAPSTSPVSNLEARTTAAMPTGAENLTAQTSIKTAGMQGQTQRDVEAMRAKSAMDVAKFDRGPVDTTAGSSGNTAIDAALADPTGQTYFSMPNATPQDKQLRSAVAAAMIKRHGLLPHKGTGTEMTQVESANSIPVLVATMEAMRQKWKERGVDIVTPVAGSYDKFATEHLGGLGVGTDVQPKYQAEYQRDTQIMNGLANMGSMQETRALTGRYNEQTGKRLLSQYPNVNMTEGKFQGAITEASLRSNQIRNSVLSTVWGGKIPATVSSNNTISPEAKSMVLAIVRNDPELGKRLGFDLNTGADTGGASTGAGTITTPDGLNWRKNPDGSMTQVQ